MNVYKVIVVFAMVMFSSMATYGVEHIAAETQFSGIVYEMLLTQLQHLYDKTAELESGIQTDRENIERLSQKIDDKLNRAISVLNDAISQHAITLQSQSTFATKKVQETTDLRIAGVAEVIDQLSARIGHNFTILQTESDIAMRKVDLKLAVANRVITALQSQSNVAIRKVEDSIDQNLARVNSAIDQMSDRMDHKLTTLQTQSDVTMRKEREVTDQKLSTIAETINQLSEMTNAKLSEVIPKLSQAIDQKWSEVVDTLGHKNFLLHAKSNAAIKERLESIEQEFSEQIIVLQNEMEEMLSKHILWANHEQIRKNITPIKSKEDFARLKCQTGVSYLRFISLKSCWDMHSKPSGKYILKSSATNEIFLGYCVQTNSGKNWLQIQHRHDGSVNFTRSWKDYRDGFGIYDGEYWIGLEWLYKLTSGRPHELYVSLRDFDGNTKHARYSEFEVGSEAEHYALKKLGSYSGTAGDSLTYHIGMKFTTIDRDNDLNKKKNCASMLKAGWWYKDCYKSNLNGVYKKGNNRQHIVWEQYSSSSNDMGLGYTRMYIREL